MIESGKKMNERALAAAARTADRDKLVARDFERNAVQRVHGALAARIFATQILERDQASFIRQRRRACKPARLLDCRRDERSAHRGEAAVPPGSSNQTGACP